MHDSTMPRPFSFLSWTLAAAIALALASVGARFVGADDRPDTANALRVFDGAFGTGPDAHLNQRDGTELFCLFATPSGEDLRDEAVRLVEGLSAAFDLDWRIARVASPVDCDPDETTFFVVLADRPMPDDFARLAERIVGSRPPHPEETFPPWADGFSVSLPGPGTREIVFVDTEDISRSPEHLRSILVEEMLQSILRAADVPVTGIVSLLGEDTRDRDDWFDANAVGLCQLDMVFLELLVGKGAPIASVGAVRGRLEAGLEDLLDRAATRRAAIEPFTDDRCW